MSISRAPGVVKKKAPELRLRSRGYSIIGAGCVGVASGCADNQHLNPSGPGATVLSALVAAGWCFGRLTRDLHDFEDPALAIGRGFFFLEPSQPVSKFLIRLRTSPPWVCVHLRFM